MKNLKLLTLLSLLISSSLLSQEEPGGNLLHEGQRFTPTSKYLPGMPLFSEKVLNTPEIQAFLKIYNEGTKEEKLRFLDDSLLPYAHQQVYWHCPSLLSLIMTKKTDEQCKEARFTVAALELLRNGIQNGLKIGISEYRYIDVQRNNSSTSAASNA